MKKYLIILLSFYVLLGYSQQISFKNISIKDGLPSNLVYNVRMSQDGQLWLISNKGLSSYNGKEVTNYNEDNIIGITNRELRSLEIDKENDIWLKTKENEIFYLNKNRQIQYVLINESVFSYPNMFLSEGGEINFIDRNGHYRFDKEQQSLDTLFSFDVPEFSYSAKLISQEGNGMYTFSIKNNIIVYNAYNGLVKYTFTQPSLISAVLLNDTTILASTSKFNELFLIDINTGKVINNLANQILADIPKAHTYYRFIQNISKNLVGITSGYQGLFVLDKSTMKFSNYKHEITQVNSISSDNTYRAFSNNGDVFITSRTSGVNYYNVEKVNAFHIQSFIDNESNLVFDGHVGIIDSDHDGNLWLATSKGLLKYNPQSLKTEAIKISNSYRGILGIYAMFIDSTNKIWVSTKSDGLIVFDKNGTLIHRFSSQLTGIENKIGFVKCMAEDEAGRLWLGTETGIRIVDMNTYKQLDFNNKISSYFSKMSIAEILWKADDLFIGTRSNGAFHIKHGKVNKLAQIGDNRSQTIQNIKVGTNNHLYQGTNSGLIISKYDTIHNVYNPIKKIINDRILSIEQDDRSNMWIATENKLYKYNQNTDSLASFGKESQFLGGGFRMNAVHKTNTGLILYGMNTGLNFINPEKFRTQYSIPNTYITSIYNGQEYKYLTENEDIELPYDRNNITLTYQNHDIWSAPDLDYQYSLDKSNDIWEPILTFPLFLQNLSSGHHEIQIRASLDNSNWVNSKNTINLFIEYPWWKSNWFYTFISILAMLIMYGLAHFINIYQDRKSQEKKYDEALRSFSFLLHRFSDLSNVFNSVVEIALRQLNSSFISIYIMNEETNTLELRTTKYSDHSILLAESTEVNFEDIIIKYEKVKKSLIPIIDNPPIEKDAVISNSIQINSSLTAPIISNSEVIGLIDCGHTSKEYFNQRHLSFLTALATIVGSKIEAESANRERKNTQIKLHNNLQRISEIEMKALRAQMNPHFMFNCLNSINNFILKNDQDNASDYLTNFAQLMRIILENSRSDWVTLEREMEALQLYIKMETLRFENAFFYHENIDETVNQISTFIPPMLIQPYIENAIWHGLLPSKRPSSNLLLKIYEADKVLNIIIEDDGIGRNQSIKNKSKFNFHKKSFGMQIISERLSMINDIYNLNASVEIFDISEISDSKTGTRVHLKMDIKNYK